AANPPPPTPPVGGEPLKAFLVRDRIGLDTGLASVVVDKTTMVMGQALLLAAGLAVAAIVLAAPRDLLFAMVALLGAEIIGVGGFAFVQLRGGVTGAGRILERLGVGAIARHRDLLPDLDRRLLHPHP